MEALSTYRHNRNLPGVCIQLGAWESKAIQNLDLSAGFVYTMKHQTGIPLLLKAMFTPVPVQVIASLDIGKLASLPAYKQDPLFHEILLDSEVTGMKTREPLTDEAIFQRVSSILRTILELKTSEELG